MCTLEAAKNEDKIGAFLAESMQNRWVSADDVYGQKTGIAGVAGVATRRSAGPG